MFPLKIQPPKFCLQKYSYVGFILLYLFTFKHSSLQAFYNIYYVATSWALVDK